MASQSEVSTRLSADNSQYRSVMNQSERVAENTGKAIFKKLDIRSSVGAVAAAIGFNITNIAERVARFVSGVSKEAEDSLEKVMKLTEETAAIYDRIYRKRRTDQQNIESDEAAQNRLLRERQSILEEVAKRQDLVEKARARAAKLDADKKLVGSAFGGSFGTVEDAKQTESQMNRLAEIAKELAEKEESIDDAKRKRDEEAAKQKQEDLKKEKDAKEDIAKRELEYHADLMAAEKEGAKVEAENREKDGEEALAWYKKRASLEKQLRDQKLETLKPEERISFLAEEVLKWKKEQARFDKDSNEYMALQVKINDNNLNIEKEQKEIAEEKLKAEKDITKEKQKQIAISTTGRGDVALTDRELERKISNIEKDIFSRSLYGGGAGIGANLLLESQRGNLAQSRSELDFRKRIRMEAGRFGEDYALNRNPGLSEQRLREILNGQDKTANGRIATSLEKLEKQFQQGIPTVIFGSE